VDRGLPQFYIPATSSLQERRPRTLKHGVHAASHMDLHRLPELFCGFHRHAERGPTLYPVACIPQAWASAAPFGLLSAVLGIDFDPRSGHVIFRHPRLPDPIDQVCIRNLRIGSGAIEILLRRYGRDVAVNVLDKTGPVEVEVLL
jgi:glycogen debranching enzyme